ncbi:DUF190 domain-containing protein [Speluncibacter jeojiensis]|uniref:DUF190 domain-containing protein n=1 Tax=Speluncibacter jeojiensis TaxID=2710754 RepID=A0A9X4M166_9ACTN|nr:DUF190 domain-containing protein [Corynebacteriales bacterium D3-21]
MSDGHGAAGPLLTDGLKLTAYFGERQRTSEGFLADAIVGRFTEQQVAASVVLRGVEGFGVKHRLRTDQLLSLSEDPPMAAAAVDTTPRIEKLLPAIGALEHRGLVTLERSRLLRSAPATIELPEDLHEAAKATIYLGRHERCSRRPTFVEVCELLHRRGAAGATVLLGVDGTVAGLRERARFFSGNANVPLMVHTIAPGPLMAEVLPEVAALLREPMITLERVRVCKRDGTLFDRPHPLPATDAHGLPLWQKLMIYTDESARHQGMPIHRALIRRLRQISPARGATALRGIWGFHGDDRPHGDKLFALGRHVPVTTVVIDTPGNIAAVFDVVDELTAEHGLVTSEMVPALAALGPDGDPHGLHLARHRYP